MKFSEIGAALAALVADVKLLTTAVTGIGAKAAAATPLTADEKAALTAELNAVKITVTALENGLVAATTALQESTTTISTLTGQVATLTADLANKQKLATAGAAAAAELAAAQTIPPLATGTDAGAGGLSAEDTLRAQLKTPGLTAKQKGETASKLRAMRDVSFEPKLVRANAA